MNRREKMVLVVRKRADWENPVTNNYSTMTLELMEGSLAELIDKWRDEE
tara:strand:- start:177 stop:323 length:147 start_codon:yes stop_codon:yes gene_type:complete